jgi:SNF2 family DNA or RNA helicase
VYLINRENVPWLVAHYGQHWPFDCVVIDESSSFKSSKAQRWKALKKVRKHIDRMIQLTATPASNGLVDLWAQLYLLDSGHRLGRTKTGYLQRWFESDYWGRVFTPRAGADAAIRDRVSDIVLSMQASDYLKMPDRIDVTERVKLPASVLDRYKALESDLMIELGEAMVDATNAAALAGKLMQICNGAVYTDDGVEHMHDAKLDALAELREQSTEPMLVAYSYRHDLARLRERFPDAVPVTAPGAIDRWNHGKIPMMLAHPASAGHGLNLQHGGSLIVWFGLTWSLELYQQFNGRLHRQGQTRPVRVVHLVAQDCIDQRVMRALANKHDVQSGLLTGLRDLYNPLQKKC